MSDLIRTDTVFGKRVNIVGNISADLVLESLGKVYIKSRNKALTLEELITSLVNQDPNTSTSKVKVVEGIEDLDTSEFKDGTFIFDKLSNILYLYIDEELLELINVAPEGTGYVKRTGDTMTGRLTIYVNNGPPLYVNSAQLVENLNAEYLNGENAESFTRRNKDEKIGGKWTFKRLTTFESNTLFLKDIVTHGSIGSPSFSTGFGGYGWRMDADTNTLTVDNLVVRKLMHVYELVVNKISATNGSLWVTNAGKVSSALKLEIKENSFFDTADAKRFCAGLPAGFAFIKLTTTYETLENEVFSTPSGEGIVLKENCPNVTTLSSAKLVIRSNNPTSCEGSKFDNTTDKRYHLHSLFDENFKFKCTFPIITRLAYQDYLADPENFNILEAISYIEPYYKYFAKGDFYLVNFDSDSLPVFKPGDIIRCQKWTYGGIKYYDGIICNNIDKSYVIQLAPSILDIKTTVSYDSSLEPQYTVLNESLNEDLYKSSVRTPKPKEGDNLDILGLIEENDSIVLMGNIWDSQRQNAVYITSTDNGAPFMDVLSGINRPDYSVIYYVPIFLTIKLYASPAPSITGFTNAIDIPYTGDYYVLDSEVTQCDYTYFSYTSNGVTGKYLAKGKSMPLGATLIHYLSSSPNKDCLLGKSEENFNILLEDGGRILLEDYVGTERFEGDYFLLLEEGLDKLTIASTRTTKARFGNLDSVQDELFPIDKLPYGYGLYGQNVFLTGEFYLNNGQSVADIGRDAIAFAVASAKAQNDARYLLEQDLKRADMLLKNNTYSKNLLYTAGMYINNNALMVLWANLLMIVTRQDEFTGTPTAIFENGKISGKFIQAYDIHSAWHSDLTTKLVALVLLTSSGTKYYQEVLVYPKLDENDLLMKDSNNKLLYYCNELPSLTLTEDDVYESYTEFGWHLKALGDGYLAQGNISWNKNGKLNLKGDIFIELPYGMHILDSTGYNTLNITSNNAISLTSWANTSKSRYINFNGSYSNLSTTSPTGSIYTPSNVVYWTVDGTTAFGIIHTEQVNQSNSTLTFTSDYTLKYNINARSSVDGDYLFVFLNFEDSTTRMYRLPPNTTLSYTIGSTAVSSFYICIIGNAADSIYGSFGYTSMNLASEIGANFMGLVSGNNMIWFGSQGFRVGGIPNNMNEFSHSALAVDSRGIVIITNNNSSTLKGLASSLDLTDDTSIGIDLLYSLDGTSTTRLYTDDYRILGDGTKQYKEYDANNPSNYWTEDDSIVNGETIIMPYLYVSVGEGVVHIIKPSTLYRIIGRILGSNIRVGKIIVIALDIMSDGDYKEVKVHVVDGRIYNYNGDGYYDLHKDYPISPNNEWAEHYYNGITLNNNPLILMYMGLKTLDNKNWDIWKSLTPSY